MGIENAGEIKNINEQVSSDISTLDTTMFGAIGNYYSNKCCKYTLNISPNDIVKWKFSSDDQSDFKYKIEYEIDIEKTLVYCFEEKYKIKNESDLHEEKIK